VKEDALRVWLRAEDDADMEAQCIRIGLRDMAADRRRVWGVGRFRPRRK
jgi:hypothetical protein